MKKHVLAAAVAAASVVLLPIAFAAENPQPADAAAANADGAKNLESISVIGQGETRQVQRVTVQDTKVLPAGTSIQKVLNRIPGVNVQSDDEMLEWIKKNAETTYHPVGTCKMGRDPMAVVDDQLRVHGMQGLRVADASIMPTLTSGNTNAPSIMIGEKASRMVLAAAAERQAA